MGYLQKNNTPLTALISRNQPQNKPPAGVCSVTIAVCRVLLSLDSVVDFMPMNWHVTRSDNAKPYFVASNIHNRDRDVVTDVDDFVFLP